MFHCIKQLEEKIVATEIDLLVWSDRMDLVAVSNAKGIKINSHAFDFQHLKLDYF